jgi:hypothetical protein
MKKKFILNASLRVYKTHPGQVDLFSREGLNRHAFAHRMCVLEETQAKQLEAIPFRRDIYKYQDPYLLKEEFDQFHSHKSNVKFYKFDRYNISPTGTFTLSRCRIHYDWGAVLKNLSSSIKSIPTISKPVYIIKASLIRDLGKIKCKIPVGSLLYDQNLFTSIEELRQFMYKNDLYIKPNYLRTLEDLFIQGIEVIALDILMDTH